TAECALARGDAQRADSFAGTVTESRDHARASHAHYLMGRAAEARGDWVSAAAEYAAAANPVASIARARALLAAGNTGAARALIDSLRRKPLSEEAWANVLEDLSGAAGAESASATLDAILSQASLTAGARARLLMADGDRLFQHARLLDRAAARYQAASALVPDSVPGHAARIRLLRVHAAQCSELAQLRLVRDELAAATTAGLDAA